MMLCGKFHHPLGDHFNCSAASYIMRLADISRLELPAVGSLRYK